MLKKEVISEKRLVVMGDNGQLSSSKEGVPVNEEGRVVVKREVGSISRLLLRGSQGILSVTCSWAN